MCINIVAQKDFDRLAIIVMWFPSLIPTINSLLTIWLIVPFRRKTYDLIRGVVPNKVLILSSETAQ